MWEVYRRLPREQVRIAAGRSLGDEEFDKAHHVDVTRVHLLFPNWGLVNAAGRRAYARAYRDVNRLRQAAGRESVCEAIHAARCLPEGGIAWGLKLRYGTPYLVYVHGEEMGYAESSRELSFLAARVLKGARVLVANSRNTREMLLERWGVPEGKVRVLHPGVDAEQFVPAERDEGVRERLGWRGRRVVLTVGRLQKRKGHDMLLRALPAIRARVPDVLYAIVGAGEERATLERLADELGVRPWVQFCGEPDDAELVRRYQQCDLFVLPNRQVGDDFEGFGMVLVEAQACGKPVLAGKSGGTAETMRIPETGCVVDCNEPHELAAAVSELLADAARREAMGEAARRWAVEQFDWRSLCQKAAALFEVAGVGEVGCAGPMTESRAVGARLNETGACAADHA
jgi:phosphatidylinositol alpha-1,6-mannosyltransferase